MQHTLEALLHGRPVSDWYGLAKQHWQIILGGKDAADDDLLAVTARAEQRWFEENCGGRDVGLEVMVSAGIARYYTTAYGFRDDDLQRARAMFRGLLKSRCSEAVHDQARRLAAVYPELTTEAVG